MTNTLSVDAVEQYCQSSILRRQDDVHEVDLETCRGVSYICAWRVRVSAGIFWSIFCKLLSVNKQENSLGSSNIRCILNVDV